MTGPRIQLLNRLFLELESSKMFLFTGFVLYLIFFLDIDCRQFLIKIALKQIFQQVNSPRHAPVDPSCYI